MWCLHGGDLTEPMLQNKGSQLVCQFAAYGLSPGLIVHVLQIDIADLGSNGHHLATYGKVSHLNRIVEPQGI